MTDLLKAELLKLRTTRTFVALAGIAIAIALILTGLVSILGDPTEENVLTEVFASDTSSLFILMLAIVGISGEWRHRTIVSSVLAAPDRRRFLAAKTLAFATAGLLLSLAISAAVAILGLTVLSVRDLPLPELGEFAAQVGRNAALAALLGALGVGIGALVRNQVVAIVGVLVLTFVVEPTLLGIVPDFGRFGPLTALPLSVVDMPASDPELRDLNMLSPNLAVTAMLAWIGAFFATAAALLRRRDLN